MLGRDAHYWFHRRFTAPAAAEGQQLFFQLRTGNEGSWDSVNPQGIVYLNGELVQGWTSTTAWSFWSREKNTTCTSTCIPA